MARELAHVPYDEFAGNLETWLRRVARDNETIVVETAEGVRVVLRPLLESHPQRRRAAPRGKALTEQDALWNMVGVGRSGLSDVSENKHKYLAEAHLNQPHKA